MVGRIKKTDTSLPPFRVFFSQFGIFKISSKWRINPKNKALPSHLIC